jgi:sulfonate transport system ATP-binding protein
VLGLTNVCKTYPNGLRALDSVTLNVAPGEIVAVVGASGCGKSTLLRIICGLERPTAGRVVLDGTGIEGPREEIGIVFQEPRLFPWLPLENRPSRERADRIAAQLARVGLGEKAGVWPRELSGGQAQRVSLARALIMRPQVLLLDEPFSALDALTRADLQNHLLDLWADGKPTLVVVTHDIDEAVVLADRIVVMRPRPGRVLAEIASGLPRPRDCQSAGFDHARQRILAALGHSRDRATKIDDGQTESELGAGSAW